VSRAASAGLVAVLPRRLDDCADLVVADALKREGVNARVACAETAIENDEASSVSRIR
jgi:hypothetical protein